MDRTNVKFTVQLVISCVVIFVGLFLLVCGFWTVPVGELSNSVLIAWGEVSTFAGALIGIDYTYKYKIFLKENDKED